MSSPGIVFWSLVVQNDAEQSFMNSDATVIFDKVELAKSIHEEAYAGASGADHLRQRFLDDSRNVLFGIPGWPNSVISNRIRTSSFSLELKS